MAGVFVVTSVQGEDNQMKIQIERGQYIAIWLQKGEGRN